MRLRELLPGLDVVETHGDLDHEFHRLTRDSREASADTLFVAIRGARVDGHDLISGLPGGSVVLYDREMPLPAAISGARVRDTRAAMGPAAAAIHGHPASTVRVVGVTGTKGKTTTTALLEGALTHAGRRAGRIGTTGTVMAGEPVASDLTTPDAPELQALLARMRDAQVTDVAIEVSSIGVVQHRVAGIPFHFAIFTNLGRDHLDFHGTIDAYVDAKARLFSDLLRPPGGLPRAALNRDDPAWTRLSPPADHWTYGFDARADLHIERWSQDAHGQAFVLRTPLGDLAIHSPLVGRHNASNLAAAAAGALACGLSPEQAARGLAAVAGVPGRLEGVPNEHGVLVVVDYAHTAESLEAVLTTLRDVSDGRLIAVFGCGGDRDPGKRPEMGAVAARHADLAVVTSDNPRSESPQAIVDAIVAGMSPPPAHVEIDRRAAIRWAIAAAHPGDIVLIAGKGHETYQEVGGHKHPFDDREEARRALAARRRTP